MTPTNSATKRERTFTWPDPMASIHEASTLPGIEYLRAIVRGELPGPPIAYLMDFEFIEANPGRIVMAVTPKEFHYNPIGNVHGGLAATMLDSVMACAVHSTLSSGVAYTTLDMNVHFVRPLTIATGRVLCIGEVVHAGSRVATAQGRIEDESGRLYAHATETCLILGQRPAKESA